MPILLKSPEDTMALGEILAQAMLRSSIRALYLFAELGGGKTTFVRGFVSAFPGGENAEVSSPSFTLYNAYPTAPEILHADLYRLSEGTSLPEELEDLLEAGNPFLVLEWPQYLAKDCWNPERLEIHLSYIRENLTKSLDNSNESVYTYRLATINACGEAARLLLCELKPRLEKRFPPID